MRTSACRTNSNASRAAMAPSPARPNAKPTTRAAWTRAADMRRKFEGSAFVAALVLLCSAAPALADEVYLTCTCDTGPPSARRYITVDYGAGSVVTSDINTLAPYGTTQNIQITDSQIV